MKLKIWHILGIIFTIIAGSLLHFTYEWSGKNPIIGSFSAVNESTWEHLKMLFVPFTVFAIIEYFAYGKNRPNFIPVKFIAVLGGISTIVILYYTYKGVLGKNITAIDIAIYILGVLVAYWISYYYLQTFQFSYVSVITLSCLCYIILALCFVIFTYRTPHIGLFYDPATQGYGIYQYELN